MGSIDRPTRPMRVGWSVVFVLLLSSQLSVAQPAPKPPATSKGGDRVMDEIARLTAEIGAAPAGTKKRDALLELASLKELSGDIEGAAAAYADAAFAAGEGRDDAALLEAARCLVAIGEIDRAYADLRTVLITGRNEGAVKRARYLGAQIAAFGGEADAVSTLSSFVEDPDYVQRRPATLYLLWRLTSDESYRKRLMTDHEASPEAALVAGSRGSTVSIAQTPLWIFFPAHGIASPSPSSAASAPAGPPSPALVAEPARVPSETHVLADPSREAAGHPIALQIGLFRREQNATALMKRLDAAGFTAELSRRTVGADEYYVVTVSGGVGAEDTALRLKDAGFESYPLY